MTQSVNTVPQLLKGLNIAFSGIFEPYSKQTLIKMCEHFGAKNVTTVSMTTSALVQGTHTRDFFGNVHYGRDINNTKKGRAAIQKGVRIVSNDKIDEYFIQKTGHNVKELMKMVKNESFSSQQSNQNVFPKNIPKPQVVLNSQMVRETQTIDENQNQQKIQQYESIGKRVIDQSKKPKNKVQENIVEIEELQSKILSFFETFKNDYQKTKGVCHVCFNEALDTIQEIQNQNDANTIHQKANELKKDVERCFFIYRTLNKSLKNYERELRPLIQKEHEILDTKSVFSSLSRNNSYDSNQQKLSKKEKLAIKKQQKKIEKQQTQAPNLINKVAVQKTLSDENSQEKNVHKSDDKDSAYLPALLFLKRNFSQDEILERYKKLHSSQNKWQKSLNRYSLSNFVFIKAIKNNPIFSMSEFLRYDWRELQRLIITSCELTSEDWTLLCEKSSILFKNLKVLSLTSNKISEIRKEEILQFQQLQGLNLGKDPNNANPLSIKSINELIQWQQQSNFNGKTIFYKKI